MEDPLCILEMHSIIILIFQIGISKYLYIIACTRHFVANPVTYVTTFGRRGFTSIQ